MPGDQGPPGPPGPKGNTGPQGDQVNLLQNMIFNLRTLNNPFHATCHCNP